METYSDLINLPIVLVPHSRGVGGFVDTYQTPLVSKHVSVLEGYSRWGCDEKDGPWLAYLSACCSIPEGWPPLLPPVDEEPPLLLPMASLALSISPDMFGFVVVVVG